jgi:hypothetical protein
MHVVTIINSYTIAFIAPYILHIILITTMSRIPRYLVNLLNKCTQTFSVFTFIFITSYTSFILTILPPSAIPFILIAKLVLIVFKRSVILRLLFVLLLMIMIWVKMLPIWFVCSRYFLHPFPIVQASVRGPLGTKSVISLLPMNFMLGLRLVSRLGLFKVPTTFERGFVL